MMQELQNFIRAVQSAKKHLSAPEPPKVFSDQQFKIALAQILSDNKLKWATLLASGSKFTPQFHLDYEFDPLIKLLTNSDQPLSGVAEKPTGLISVILSRHLGVRLAIENLLHFLPYKNALLIRCSSRTPEQTEVLLQLISILQSRFQDEWNTGAVQMISGTHEVSQLMASHPAVNAVFFTGSRATLELFKQAPTFLEKKWHARLESHNTGIWLPQNVEAEAEIICKSVFAGGGTLPWNVHNWLVLEKDFSAAAVSLKACFEANLKMYGGSEKNQSEIEADRAVFAQIKKESGKIVFGGVDEQRGLLPTLVQDLTHCSSLQIEPLAKPLLLLSSIKYLHEASKWTSQSPYGLVTMLVGDETKLTSLAKKIDVPFHYLNNWLEQAQFLPVGKKQSFFGVSDLKDFSTL